MPVYPITDPARWYSDPLSSNNLNNTTATGYAQGQAFMYPIEIYKNGTIKAMGVYKTNNGNRTALSIALAVYNVASDGRPGTVLADFGVLSLATASQGVISVNGTAVVTPGTYYIAIKLENAGSGVATPSFIKRNTTSRDGPHMPFGFSGTHATDFAATSAFNAIALPVGYTGLATGAWVDLTSTAPVAMPAFNFYPLYTFTASPTDGPFWGWGGTGSSSGYWQTVP